jgi:hypothetical protein
MVLTRPKYSATQYGNRIPHFVIPAEAESSFMPVFLAHGPTGRRNAHILAVIMATAVIAVLGKNKSYR